MKRAAALVRLGIYLSLGDSIPSDAERIQLLGAPVGLNTIFDPSDGDKRPGTTGAR
jgi:hypothetical protein